MNEKQLSRRSFLSTSAKTGAAIAAAPLIVPRHVLGGTGRPAPNDRLNIAGIGVGGKGKVDLGNIHGHNVVALCDVDWDYAAPVFKKYPKAKRYRDYRKMLDEMDGEIDGVVVATPDHTHALPTLAAMERGIHVYTQKPLTWSVAEARVLQEAAERTGVVTQMGNQGHSADEARLVNEWIRSGAIGDVSEVHVWSDRPLWPQGVPRPEKTYPIPETLNWDLFLGPAPKVSYAPAYHPWTWRGWVDYGTSALGDMGAHLIDHPYWALDLDYPERIATRSTKFNGVSWPAASMTYYSFPAKGDRQAVKLVWYDGGLKPGRPAELPAGEDFHERRGGVLYVGSKGKLIHSSHGGDPRFLPEELDRQIGKPPRTFERVPNENHEMNWISAILGEAEAVSPFSYAAPLTETMLLGLVSLRAGNREIHYDAEGMRVTNVEEANQFLRRQNPRESWALQAGTHG